MNDFSDIQALAKALEAGGYNAAPGSLTQGGAIQIEDLDAVNNIVTVEEDQLVLQKLMGAAESAKSLTYQFNRQLSHGEMGGSAQLEGQVGRERDLEIARITVPMAFYSRIRRSTLPANMVETFDGVKADDRQAKAEAITLACDVEYDLFRGQSDFSLTGVFDGSPEAVSEQMANLPSLDLQVRQSDILRNARDRMFDEFGNDESVVIQVGGALTQDVVEDAQVLSSLNFGTADVMLLDPVSHSQYNKIAHDKERIILAGSPQESTGAQLRKQHTSAGTTDFKTSQFLRAKYKPRRPVADGPGAPTFSSASTAAGDGTPFEAGQSYTYLVTAGNEIGESRASAAGTQAVTADGDRLVLTITPAVSGSIARWFNVYRTEAGAPAASAKYIGRVKAAVSGTTVFTDLDNRSPGFVTGYLIQGNTMQLRQLAPFSRKPLAETDLSSRIAFFRFLTLAVFQPRKNVIIDNLSGVR